MRNTSVIGLVAACLFMAAPASDAGWLDKLKGLVKEPEPQGEQALATQALTEREMIDGILEALSVGIKRAVQQLGSEGGYLKDPQVKIPMPDGLKSVEKGLRALGQDKVADEFIETMNRAAERAAPKATAILMDAISHMSLQDAQAILDGPEDAATRYFKGHTYTKLSDATLPVVKQATDEVGVTAHYKKLMDKAGFLGGVVDKESIDIDRYVTGKALDGLFVKLAEEEGRIRKDPVARTSGLLKRVFGSLSR